MNFANYLLRGIGQIMLQENRWTGLLFLIGLFIGSWQYGVAALLAATTGTLTAIILKFDREKIKTGFYGFSPALVGVAMVFFFQSQMLIWLFIIPGSVFASMLQHFFLIKNIPAFTFPFVLTTWMLVFLLHHLTAIAPSDLFFFKSSVTSYDAVFMGIRGFGQLIFQPKTISGLLFLLGVLIHTPIAAFYGLIASYMGGLIAYSANLNPDNITAGLFGFNAILSSIVFSGYGKKDAFGVLTAVIITVFINILLVQSHWLDSFGGVLTFPFVAGTGITLLLKKWVLRF